MPDTEKSQWHNFRLYAGHDRRKRPVKTVKSRQFWLQDELRERVGPGAWFSASRANTNIFDKLNENINEYTTACWQKNNVSMHELEPNPV